MITPKLKDKVLSCLCSEGMDFDTHYQIPKSSFLKELIDDEDKANSCTENELTSILSQFARLGFISGYFNNSTTIELEILVEAQDFYSHGGFQAQEEILKANIEKLGRELEVLAKELSPNHLDTANKLAGIGSAILAALPLFKS